MKLRELYQTLNEDTLAQQEINALSQAILNYINSNPQVIKPNGHFELKDIPGLPKFNNPDVARMAEGSVIKFSQLGDDVAGAADSEWLKKDPVTGKLTGTDTPIYKAGRANAKAIKTGNTPLDFIRSWIKNGGRLTVYLPYDVITRKAGQPLNNFYNNTLSTISHELNHIYTNVRGRFNGAERRAVDANKAAAPAAPIVKDILKNASNPNYDPYTSNYDAFQKYWIKNHGPGATAVGEWVYARETEVRLSKYITQLEGWIETAKGFTTIDETDQIAKYQAEIAKYKEQIKASQATQKTAMATIKTIKPVNPKIPTEWTHNVYQATETELSSRFQQVTNDLAEKIKPGMSSEQINAAVSKSFADHNIASVMVGDDTLSKIPTDVKTKWQNSSANMASPDMTWKMAMYNPRFRDYYNKAIKFWQAESANPISKSVEARKTLGDRFKAYMLDIPQEYVGKAALPSANDVAKYQGQKIVNSIEASRGISGAALWGVQKVLVPAATAYQIGEAIKQIMDLPDDLPQQEFERESTKIVGRLVAEFGLGYVAAVAGAILASMAGATAAGIGAVPAALVGFVVGGIAGITANYFVGDDVKKIVDAIVDFKYGRLPQQRPQPAQVQQPQQRPQPAQPVQPTPRAPAPKALAGQPALNYESLLHQLRK